MAPKTQHIVQQSVSIVEGQPEEFQQDMEQPSSTEGWGMAMSILASLCPGLFAICSAEDRRMQGEIQQIRRGAQPTVVQARVRPQPLPSRIRHNHHRPSISAIWGYALVIVIAFWISASVHARLVDDKMDIDPARSIQETLGQQLFANIQQLGHVIAFGMGSTRLANDGDKAGA